MSYESALAYYVDRIQRDKEFIGKGVKVDHQRCNIAACERLIMRDMLECGVVEDEACGFKLMIVNNELVMERL